MKAKELRVMSAEALIEEVLKRRREIFNLRMQAASGQGIKPDQFGKARKDIARIKTILREKAQSERET
jgi:large subunit ribosomal protein L29